MNSSNRLLIILIIVLLLTGCKENPIESGIKYPPGNFEKVTINQGVWGNVWYWEGDFMPGTPTGTITQVIRDVYIYKATLYNKADNSNLQGAFYREVHTDLAAVVRSDNSGFFQLELDPGTYSFFVKEDSLFYANGTDGDGYILPAVVKKDSVTKRQIDITYNATF